MSKTGSNKRHAPRRCKPQVVSRQVQTGKQPGHASEDRQESCRKAVGFSDGPDAGIVECASPPCYAEEFPVNL